MGGKEKDSGGTLRRLAPVHRALPVLILSHALLLSMHAAIT